MKIIKFLSKTHGSHIAIVDDIDYKRLKCFKTMKWSIVKKRNNLIYFQKRLPGNKLVELHRWIMQPKKGEYVDHIDGNTLDNRRCNLRICTNAANLRNGVHIRPNNTSGVTGVWKHRNKWIAEIKVNYKKIHLGTFNTLKEAAQARKQAEKKYFNI